MGMVFQSGDGVLVMGWSSRGEWDTRHRWGSRHRMMGTRQGMMGCQAGVGNNINELPKWNSSLLDFYRLWFMLHIKSDKLCQ